MKIGFLHSLIRKDEKLLLDEFNTRKNVDIIMIDDRELIFKMGQDNFDYNVVLERSINHSRALHAIVLFESAGIKCINSSQIAFTCGDKLLTSKALEAHKVPQPDVRIAFYRIPS